jgi:hypothetical protein
MMRWAIGVIVAALLIAGLLMVLGPVVSAAASARGPVQPIAFAHSVHVAVDQIDCVFCHRGVTRGPAATLPAVEQCMFCHQVVTPGDSLQAQEVEKIRTAFRTGDPITWQRVHRVPDHVHFTHEAHIRGLSERQGVTDPKVLCATCHGDVTTNTPPTAANTGGYVPLRQMRPLNMGDCVNCHRQNNAPTDCVFCHY